MCKFLYVMVRNSNRATVCKISCLTCIYVYMASDLPPPLDYILPAFAAAYSLAASPTEPILNFSACFLSTFSLWYFQKALVAFLPPKRLRIFSPPGCSGMNSANVSHMRRMSCVEYCKIK